MRAVWWLGLRECFGRFLSLPGVEPGKSAAPPARVAIPHLAVAVRHDREAAVAFHALPALFLF